MRYLAEKYCDLMTSFLFQKELGEDKNNEISVKEEAPFISNADDVGTAVDSSTPVSTGNTADSDATGNNSKNVSIELDNVIIARNATY